MAAGSALAAFEGLTSVGVNYEFRDDEHMGGLASQTFGYISDMTCWVLI